MELQWPAWRHILLSILLNIVTLFVQSFCYVITDASFLFFHSHSPLSQLLGYDFDYDDFHACVHGTLPYEKLKPDPVLRQLLLSLPQRKIVSSLFLLPFPLFLLYHEYLQSETASLILQIFTNSDKAHAARVLKKMGLEDCFEGIICFETLNPPTEQNVEEEKNNADATDTDGRSEARSDGSAPPRRGILCKPSLESMEAVIEIANLDPKRTVSDRSSN